MAYTLHIVRESEKISLKEWISVVKSVEGAKLDRTLDAKSVGDEGEIFDW